MQKIPYFASSNRVFFYCSILNNRCGGIFPQFYRFCPYGRLMNEYSNLRRFQKL